VTDELSEADHVRDIITNCAQIRYALRVLRAYGMCDSALQTIYRSVIIIKLLYVSSCLVRLHERVRRTPNTRIPAPHIVHCMLLLSTQPTSILREEHGSVPEALRSDSVKCPPSAVCSSPVNYSCLSKLQSANSTSRQTVTTSGHLMDSSSPVCCIRTPTNLNFN